MTNALNSDLRGDLRRVLWRYMEMCDVPSMDRSQEAMEAILHPDMVWNAQKASSKQLDSRQGAAQVSAMLFDHIDGPFGFAENEHYLNRGEFSREQSGRVTGEFRMIRQSLRRNGTRETVVSDLHVEFARSGGAWLISGYKPIALEPAPPGDEIADLRSPRLGKSSRANRNSQYGDE